MEDPGGDLKQRSATEIVWVSESQLRGEMLDQQVLNQKLVPLCYTICSYSDRALPFLTITNSELNSKSKDISLWTKSVITFHSHGLQGWHVILFRMLDRSSVSLQDDKLWVHEA